MGKRYTIAKESVFEDCWVTPEDYKGVFERLEQFWFSTRIYGRIYKASRFKTE
jgi:hypothetical protein